MRETVSFRVENLEPRLLLAASIASALDCGAAVCPAGVEVRQGPGVSGTPNVRPSSASPAGSSSVTPWGQVLDLAVEQLIRSVDEAGGPTRYPRSTSPATGRWVTHGAGSWTSGFFPGQLWMLHEATGDQALRQAAEHWTANLTSQARRTNTHDVGFMIFDSFGQGFRVTGSASYKQTLLTAATSLATRFDEDVGAIRSWDIGRWQYPVIIDNMMNLELLLWASKNGPDPGQNQQWHDIAVRHADVAAANHIREDGSTYHVFDFDPVTGKPLGPYRHQGSSVNSTWARGQAWAIYGFTMVYRETGQLRFLETAMRAADYFLDNLPVDSVPYWDFDAPGIRQEPKDSSSAAIAASGLVELSQLVHSASQGDQYLDAARRILDLLRSNQYLSDRSVSRGILLHGTGGKPQNSEIDVSLIYGDYYFIEALLRLRQLLAGDVSDDGSIDNLDIHGFIGALTVGGPVGDATKIAEFLSAVPDGHFFAADVNTDGRVDNVDITAFLERLANNASGAAGALAQASSKTPVQQPGSREASRQVLANGREGRMRRSADRGINHIPGRMPAWTKSRLPGFLAVDPETPTGAPGFSFTFSLTAVKP